jgi:tocopherol O-methyltransferase
VSAHERAVAEHYDALDRWYRELWGEHVHHGLWLARADTIETATARLVDLVAVEARIGAGDEVCDVGCGYGATARRLAATRGARVTGLTLSRAQLEVARAAAAGGAPSARDDGATTARDDGATTAREDGATTFLLRDWLANDLPVAAFDAVIALESVSHMEDRPRAFAEAARVLRPGGRLVVLDWLAAPRPRALERRHLLAPVCREGHLAGLDTLDAYAGHAHAAGLTVERAEDLTPLVRATWPKALARVARRAVRDPELRRALRDPRQVERRFPLTLARLALAARTGAFRYGLVTALQRRL